MVINRSFLLPVHALVAEPEIGHEDVIRRSVLTRHELFRVACSLRAVSIAISIAEYTLVISLQDSIDRFEST
jgi:hypothetical protein